MIIPLTPVKKDPKKHAFNLKGEVFIFLLYFFRAHHNISISHGTGKHGVKHGILSTFSLNHMRKQHKPQTN